MTLLALIRHAPTDWNTRKLLQGRTDIPLSAEGEELAAGWRLPDDLAGARLISSPLSRAMQTARLITGRACETDPRLTEMDFGAWEGRSLTDLRAEDPQAMQAEEARGWDMTPPGGESPRAVWNRVAPMLTEWAEADAPVVAVTHKGVIRAILARAWGWDFLGKPPARLQSGALHRLRLMPDGSPAILGLNEALGRREPS